VKSDNGTPTTTKLEQTPTNLSGSKATTSHDIGTSTSLQQNPTTSAGENNDGTAKSQTHSQPSSQINRPSDLSGTTSHDSGTSKSQSTESSSACGLMKRAKPAKVNGVDLDEGKIGDDETSTECARAGHDKTIHVTKTKIPIGWFTSVLPQTCSRAYSQACYHYRSVLTS